MQEGRKLSLKEKLVGFGHNVQYWMRSFAYQYSLDEALQSYEAIYLLGKLYSSGLSPDKTNKKFADAFSDIIWITYRSKFPPLLKGDNKESVVTDAGWGCMVRAGQMLFAQFLRDYFQQTNNQQHSMICSLFSDFKKEEVFSIQRIAQLGKSQYGLLPGQWYNSGKISHILELLLNGCNRPELQGLKAIVFNNSRIYLTDVLSLFQPEGHCHCSENFDLIACTKCLTSNKQVAIVVISRIGLKQPQPEYLSNLDQLMTWPWFRGCLGGINKKALYFVGIKEDEYIYLDPHYVQTAMKDMDGNNQSYRCHSFVFQQSKHTQARLLTNFAQGTLSPLLRRKPCWLSSFLEGRPPSKMRLQNLESRRPQPLTSSSASKKQAHSQLGSTGIPTEKLSRNKIQKPNNPSSSNKRKFSNTLLMSQSKRRIIKDNKDLSTQQKSLGCTIQ